jgi:hypothetical protein
MSREEVKPFLGRNPPYLSMSECAELFNWATKSNRWTTRSARKYLIAGSATKQLPNAGSMPRAPVGQRYVSTMRLIADAYPELYDEIWRNLPPDTLKTYGAVPASMMNDED